MVGIIAGCLTTFALAPQVIKLMKYKNTKSISLIMCIMQITGVFFWLVHGLMINDFAVIFANAVSFIFISIILLYKIKYK